MAKIYLILAICLLASGVYADIDELKQTFEAAEKAFYSGNPAECIPLFEKLTKELTEQIKTRALTSEESSLLERSLDYLAQSYFNQNDLTNAKASIVKLLQIDPGYQMNEDLVSVKVVNLFNELKKETLSGISITTTPADAEIFLDGRQIGKSNLQWQAVAGEHIIEIKKPGYIPEKKEITIVPQQNATVEIQLQEDPIALAEISRSQGDLSAAARYLEQSITLHEKAGDKKSMAAATRDLAETLIALRRTDAALDRYRQVVQLYKELNDDLATATAFEALGDLFRTKSDIPQANQSYEEALKIDREVNDPTAAAKVLSKLGEIAIQQKRFAEATTHFEEARSLFEKANDRKNMELMERKITQIRGEWKGKAVELLREGFQLMNELQYEKAEQKYSQALEAARASNDKSSQLGALLALGFLIFQRKDVPAAQSVWEEALKLARETGEKENEALALYDLSTIYYTLRDYSRAEQYYRQSEQLYRSLNLEPRKRPWETKQ